MEWSVPRLLSLRLSPWLTCVTVFSPKEILLIINTYVWNFCIKLFQFSYN